MNLEKADDEEKALTTETLKKCLEDKDVGVRREGLLALVRMKEEIGKETAVKWLLLDDMDDVKDLAIRCVHELGLKEHIPAIREYLKSEDEVVKIAAIVALSQWGDEESRPAFEEAAKSKSLRLRRAGQRALIELHSSRSPRPIIHRG